MSRVITTMDYAGNIRVFDLTNEEKAKKDLEIIFKHLGAWDEEIQKSIESLDWNIIEQTLQDALQNAGFTIPGRELIVNVEELNVKNIKSLR